MTAMATILICVALIAVGSYALFSDTTRVTNHLKAGDLDIELWRIDLSGNGLDSAGYMGAVADAKDKNFTDADDSNIFDIADKYVVPSSKYTAEMMISRSSTTNVAIAYWLDFVIPNVDTSKPENEALLNQLMITIEVQKIGETGYSYVKDADGNDLVNVKLSNLSDVETVDGNGVHYAIGAMANPIDVIDTTESLTSDNIDEGTLSENETAIALFKVTVEFEDNYSEEDILDGDGNLVDNDKNPNNAAKNGKVSFDIIVNAVQVVK